MTDLADKPEIPPQTGLADIAALLAEQIAASHEAAARCFAIGADEEDYGMDMRNEALKVATRLMQASATAAAAINRLRGPTFDHRITVARVIDTEARNAARRERYRLARENDDSPGAQIQRLLDEQVTEQMADLRAQLVSVRDKKQDGLENLQDPAPKP